MDMSKSLNRRAAANAFARGENPRTNCALSFQGDVAFSYAEPIAVRVRNVLFVTTAKFSMTTSHHVGAVAGAWAVEHQVTEYNEDRSIGQGPTGCITNVDHGEIRRLARARGFNLSGAPHGKRYDKAA